jgi:hypothetical protein
MDFPEANGMMKAPHASYSPDFARSDFFLFRHLKRQLCECFFDNTDNPLPAVHDILDGFD